MNLRYELLIYCKQYNLLARADLEPIFNLSQLKDNTFKSIRMLSASGGSNYELCVHGVKVFAFTLKISKGEFVICEQELPKCTILN